MKYKAIITDLDGTAVDSPAVKVASKRLAAAVARLEGLGVKVCAATGRAYTFAKIMFETMNLSEPSIVSGGTRIVNPVNGEELWSCGLNSRQVSQIREAVATMSYGFLWNDSTEEDYLNGGWKLSDLDEEASLYFFEICFVPKAEVASVLSALEEIDGVVATVVVAQKEGTCDIHITNSEATKEHAVYELEKIIQVDKSEMIGIGDGHNDLHLYNAVAYKVAMGNAVPELKKVADRIIGNVKEEGLAQYFEELAKEIEHGR